MFHYGKSRAAYDWRQTTTDWASYFGWLALGAGLMYFTDPASGARRRAMVMNKFRRLFNEAGDAARGAAIQTRNHLSGYAHEARARFTEGPVDDVTLEERVRSQMGRAVRHPGSLQISATNGCVTLRGKILADEVKSLMANVWSVRGVKDVRNELDVRESAGNTPGLQGEGSRQSRG